MSKDCMEEHGVHNLLKVSMEGHSDDTPNEGEHHNTRPSERHIEHDNRVTGMGERR